MANEALLSERIRDSRSPAASLRQTPAADQIVFGGGLPDPVTHPAAAMGALMADILGANEPAMFGYGQEAGDAGLREIIAARSGGGLTAANIVLTNGSSGAIGLVALALLEPGDVVVVESLTYGGALKAFRQMGAQIEPAPMDADGLDPQGLEAVLKRLEAQNRRVKLIYTIATCHNPTATILSLERRREVLRMAQSCGALVAQDDTYGDILFGVPAPPPFIALAPEGAIHLGSFSKTIAPGIRVGWVAADAAISAALARARTDLGTSAMMQRLVARFIADGRFGPHLEAATALYRRKRDLMLAALDAHCAGLADWGTPQGGFFIWMRLAHGEAAAAAAAAVEEKVSFLPGPYFSAAEPFDRHLRLSYGQVAEDRIEDGIARLGRAIARAGAR
jgi:2-aminoadipate transaminase